MAKKAKNKKNVTKRNNNKVKVVVNVNSHNKNKADQGGRNQPFVVPSAPNTVFVPQSQQQPPPPSNYLPNAYGITPRQDETMRQFLSTEQVQQNNLIAQHLQQAQQHFVNVERALRAAPVQQQQDGVFQTMPIDEQNSIDDYVSARSNASSISLPSLEQHIPYSNPQADQRRREFNALLGPDYVRPDFLRNVFDTLVGPEVPVTRESRQHSLTEHHRPSVAPIHEEDNDSDSQFTDALGEDNFNHHILSPTHTSNDELRLVRRDNVIYLSDMSEPSSYALPINYDPDFADAPAYYSSNTSGISDNSSNISDLTDNNSYSNSTNPYLEYPHHESSSINGQNEMHYRSGFGANIDGLPSSYTIISNHPSGSYLNSILSPISEERLSQHDDSSHHRNSISSNPSDKYDDSSHHLNSIHTPISVEINPSEPARSPDGYIIVGKDIADNELFREIKSGRSNDNTIIKKNNVEKYIKLYHLLGIQFENGETKATMLNKIKNAPELQPVQYKSKF